MEKARSTENPTVVRLRATPSQATLALFAASFPRHPISRMDTELGIAFLRAFANDTAFFVACDAQSEDVGFLIGGTTAALDRTRASFIREHAWRIVAASTTDRSLRRLLLPRLRPQRSFNNARYARSQLRFIAVAPHLRGSGVGTQLVEAFEETLAGDDGYHTWTMAGPNGAEGFFRRMGFERDMTVGDHLRLCKPLALIGETPYT